MWHLKCITALVPRVQDRCNIWLTTDVKYQNFESSFGKTGTRYYLLEIPDACAVDSHAGNTKVCIRNSFFFKKKRLEARQLENTQFTYIIQTTRLEEIENALLCPHYNNDSKHVNGQIDNNGLKIMMNYMVNKIQLSVTSYYTPGIQT